ncbi:MAG: 30S ribosomal protein S6 [Phycisphaerae bacterium]|nr:30S ribosomal protein S6 [Phycisphaerae bacterium]
MNTYEIMFLFDPGFGSNWEAVEKEITRLMERCEAKVIVTKKLEERRLAYEIKGRRRGLYVLTYFQVAPTKLIGLERDCLLAETLLRFLILRADELSEEKMRNAVLSGSAFGARPSDDRYEGSRSRRSAVEEPAEFSGEGLDDTDAELVGAGEGGRPPRPRDEE